MPYNQRCKITTKTTKPGYLGDDEIISKTKIVPCDKSGLSSDEQVSIFGKYTKAAFKLHLQGIYDSIDTIEFEGARRNLFDLKHHRNSTVVIIS